MKKIQPLPPPVQPVIEDQISLVARQLPDWIPAFYLVGSIALGGFNEHCSDIDFVAILNGNPGKPVK